MELWIRSQDKETLLPIDKPLMYWESIDNIHTHSIIFKESPSYIITLGIYNTKERALEVLDEIQNGLLANFNFDGSYEDVDLKIKAKMIIGLYGIIYEMPKK